MTQLRTLFLLQLAMLLLPGCATPPHADSGAGTGTITFRVEKTNEHLGHSSAEVEGMYVHPEWIDGCTGRLPGTDEPFVIWWNNNEIKDLSFRFETQKTYVIRFQGKIGNGIMAHEGKCLHVRQIVNMKEAE